MILLTLDLLVCSRIWTFLWQKSYRRAVGERSHLNKCNLINWIHIRKNMTLEPSAIHKNQFQIDYIFQPLFKKEVLCFYFYPLLSLLCSVCGWCNGPPEVQYLNDCPESTDVLENQRSYSRMTNGQFNSVSACWEVLSHSDILSKACSMSSSQKTTDGHYYPPPLMSEE